MDLSFESHRETQHILEIPSTFPNCSQPKKPKASNHYSLPFDSVQSHHICFEWPLILKDPKRQNRAHTNTNILEAPGIPFKITFVKRKLQVTLKFHTPSCCLIGLYLLLTQRVLASHFPLSLQSSCCPHGRVGYDHLLFPKDSCSKIDSETFINKTSILQIRHSVFSPYNALQCSIYQKNH